MRILPLLVLSVIAFTSCAQSKVAVGHSYGFLRQNSRGALAVDEKGEPINPGPDSQYVAYVEVPSTIEPVWTKAWINQQTYDVSGTKVTSPVSPGTGLNTDLPIQVTARPGHTLWELNFQKGVGEQAPATLKSVAGSSIIVKALYNKKETLFDIKGITQLNPIIYP